ncbi:MAG: hypothetical protein JOZ29_04055 [Deltaproteobacteria bacterium]|nr:hypothetical protein [Deltaproteobacteria bacterium]
MRIAKIAAGCSMARADGIRFDHFAPADAICCSSTSRYAKYFDGGATSEVFTMRVELKQGDGQ